MLDSGSRPPPALPLRGGGINRGWSINYPGISCKMYVRITYPVNPVLKK
jgi:hypothetical protein